VHRFFLILLALVVANATSAGLHAGASPIDPSTAAVNLDHAGTDPGHILNHFVAVPEADPGDSLPYPKGLPAAIQPCPLLRPVIVVPLLHAGQINVVPALTPRPLRC
jgi:hypothetical protein